ncbi:MAG: c-type cytochrome [Rhodobacteraceae bacterium]|nr:c-type cytochrome [Paracoccaceae bacterium]
MIAVGLVLVGGFVWFSRPDASIGPAPIAHASQGGLAASGIVVPSLTGLAQQGEAEFIENCAACHGVNLAGTAQGPTLIHSLYRPSHHADGAIALAAMNGVRAHHWRFGDMPAIEGITPQKLTVIIAYIRAVQQANGVH